MLFGILLGKITEKNAFVDFSDHGRKRIYRHVVANENPRLKSNGLVGK
jgi:hypothetical protein